MDKKNTHIDLSIHLSGAWFPLTTFDCSASFRFLWLTFSESWMPLQSGCMRLNHCHVRMSYEPLQPRSLRIVWQRNKSVGIALMAALLDQNAKKPSLSLREMPSDQMESFFLISTVTQLIQSVSRVNLSFLSVCESRKYTDWRKGQMVGREIELFSRGWTLLARSKCFYSSRQNEGFSTFK